MPRGPHITATSKKGREYPPAPRLRRAGLWVRYADAEDAGAKAIVKVPVAAYVEQVYEYGDFADLEIAT